MPDARSQSFEVIEGHTESAFAFLLVRPEPCPNDRFPAHYRVMSSRVLPHSLEAEASVLGGILLRNDVLTQLDTLVEDDFYDPKHKAVFSAMRRLEEQAKPIDEVTLENELARVGRLEVVGGLSFLGDLALKVPTADNVTYYADIIRDKHAARQLMLAASEIAARGYEDYGEIQDYLDEAEGRIFEVTQRKETRGPAPIKQLIKEVFNSLDERFAAPDGITGVPTGFADLDQRTAGLQPTELVILAARPAMGKTSFALSIAQNCAASDHGAWPVLLFSLEMSSTQLAERMLCAEARVDSTALRRGRLQRQDMTNLTYAAARLSKTPILIDDTPALSLRELRARSRRFRSNKQLFGDHKTGLIVIDYLQLMRGSTQTRNGSREQEISEISRGLKALAKELDCPVLALSQLNRSLESRTDKRPQLSDLRESGAIEQDADVILFIYRDVVYNENTEEPNLAEVIIGKNRHGPTGTIKTLFEGQFTRFENLSMRPDTPPL
jgi:replicative DNA helicase